jgi:cyclopropane fatty-acyl-phospholipid synthase-like methyltransferase
MKLRYVKALRVLHETFSACPATERAHILGRFLSCPFLRVLPHLPENARVLDIGAGHGTFARMAIEAGATKVIAIEPDLRKTLPSFHHRGISFVAAFDDAIRGRFDAVTMFDVLYRIPQNEWPSLFDRVYERLEPGGVFMLKELDPDSRLKFAWNRTQEAISDRFLKLTLGDKFVYATPAEMRTKFEEAGFRDFKSIRIDRGYPHSHILYVGAKVA